MLFLADFFLNIKGWILVVINIALKSIFINHHSFIVAEDVLRSYLVVVIDLHSWFPPWTSRCLPSTFSNGVGHDAVSLTRTWEFDLNQLIISLVKDLVAVNRRRFRLLTKLILLAKWSNRVEGDRKHGVVFCPMSALPIQSNTEDLKKSILEKSVREDLTDNC